MSKKNKLKARRMWANPADFGERSMHLTAHPDPSSDRGNVVPVAVIPLDDVDELVDKAHRAFLTSFGTADGMRAALAAIGVLPKQRKGRK